MESLNCNVDNDWIVMLLFSFSFSFFFFVLDVLFLRGGTMENKSGQNASGVLCCRNGDVIDERLRHPDCFPIIIPEEDAFYAQFNQRCMEFVRSLPAIRPQCNFGPREQVCIRPNRSFIPSFIS